MKKQNTIIKVIDRFSNAIIKNSSKVKGGDDSDGIIIDEMGIG